MQFLKQVARHYYLKGDIGQNCFVFPNRRSMIFFRKYLSEMVESDSRTVLSPGMFTMNDFFYRIAGREVTGKLPLLLELYRSYCKFTPNPESLDEFIFWGDVLLSDFADVDKYLVNAKHIFTNIAQFRAMQGDLDFLSDNQRTALSSFLRHFEDDKEYKLRFRRTWDILLPLYEDFRNSLTVKGMSYEGMVYREIAQRLGSESVRDVLGAELLNCGKFVFVGLNALNECEKTLLRALRNARLADFCWDYSSPLIKDPANRSSFFMQKNVLDFPQAFEPDLEEGLPANQTVNSLSVPSGVGQAKQLPLILKNCPADISTAIVLPDENLLLPVLNSLPESVGKLNVTMGYPVKGSEFRTLMEDVAALQLHLRLKDGKWYFYHRQLSSLLSNSLIKSVLSDKGKEIASLIKKEAGYYVCETAFAGDPVLEAVFRPVVTDISSDSAEQSSAIAAYLQNLVCEVAVRLREDPSMAFEIDFAKEFHNILGTLRNENLPVRPSTLFRLFSQLSASLSVPYKGEPLEGLQIMGPLETRALDFENLIILSFNEGSFPRRSVASSFIPPELRRGFDLPTYEYQDSVWAYYFYRMIQRARNVWLVYDSRADGLRSGEKSRFISQLEIHYALKINHFVASSPLGATAPQAEVPKTAEHIGILRTKCLSASSLQNYLSCPAKFFYSKVLGLKADEEVAESLDAGMFGTVFHDTMHELYSSARGRISVPELEALLKSDRIRETVDRQICKALKVFEITGRNLIHEDIVCRYVRQLVSRDIKYIRDSGAESLEIIGLEREACVDFAGFRFKGYLDRIDSVAPDELRVVDYKTGKVSDDDFKIDDANAESVVEALFGDDNAKRPKIALQLYLYDLMVQNSPELRRPRIINSIYQANRLFLGEVENVELSGKFCSLMKERLEGLLCEIADPEGEWVRKGDEKTCEHCDFKQICGR